MGRGGGVKPVGTVTPPADVAPILSTVTPPTINEEGTSLTITLTRNVVFGAGGNGGLVLNPTGDDVTLSYASGSGTNVLVYTISRPICQTSEETAVLGYTQPGNGIEAAAGGLDLATFSGAAVTNNSTQHGEEGGALEVTNVEKLSLPIDTAVGTQVSVSDGFYVTGFGDARDGFYFPYGDAEVTHTYVKGLPFAGDGTDIRSYLDTEDTGKWVIGSDGLGYTFADAALGTYPWEATYTGLTLTHPAIQELAAPSSVQGGVFVEGGTQDGVYSDIGETSHGRFSLNLLGNVGFQIRWNDEGTPRWEIVSGGDLVYYADGDVATPDLASKTVMERQDALYTQRGTAHGKPYYNMLGEADSATLSVIRWVTAAGWKVYDSGGIEIDSSTDDTATPDLATFDERQVTDASWLNASDDTPATITVTAITAGELAAGFKIGGVTYLAMLSGDPGPTNGRTRYGDILGVAPYITWTGANWGDDNGDINLGNVAFPWQGTPEVACLRDDVAAEVNWVAP